MFFGLLASVSTAAYIILAQVRDRSAVRASLNRIEHYEIELAKARERELQEPFVQRVLLPLLQRFLGIGRRLTPADYVAKARHKLVLAGRAGADEVDRFLAIRILGMATVPVWFYVTFWVLHLHGMKGLLVVGLLSGMFAMGPDAIVNRKIAERRHEMQVQLPDVLDLLTISVEAGLGFEQALDRTVDAVPGALSDEFGRMLGEVRAGARRGDAMRALDERCDVPELRSFVLAILQADTFGVSIARVLRSQADDMRIKRRQLAQEDAQKAPVKMLIPMVFCIFPALFIVVLGPAAINMVHNLGGT
jgi:tight adherence protein C